MNEHRIKQACPQTVTCFGCREDDFGIATRAYITEDNYVVGLITTKKYHQGFPGIIHGGIIGTYFDEVLWHLYTLLDPDATAMTLNITVNCRTPVPCGQKIRVIGWIDEINGKRFTAVGRLLLPDDKIAADCKINYLCMEPERIDSQNAGEKIGNQARVVLEKADIETVRF